jgi:hypothetical protein
MIALLVIAGRFYLIKTVHLRLRNVFRRLADDLKALFNFLYHEQRTHFPFYSAPLQAFNNCDTCNLSTCLRI